MATAARGSIDQGVATPYGALRLAPRIPAGLARKGFHYLRAAQGNVLLNHFFGDAARGRRCGCASGSCPATSKGPPQGGLFRSGRL